MLPPANTAASLAASRSIFTRNANIYSDPTAYWQHDESHPVYMIIDLKSFYASVECVLRGLDPMTTDLVVADKERGEGTICLAVSASLKAKGVPGRARVYEIPTCLTYISATPRMAEYEKASAEIYAIYLQYFAPEDIHVYSCDEAFIDITSYLDLYELTPKELGMEIMNAILDATGLRSTCGIGTNMYLAKVALDILSKHSPGFIGILDEDNYRALLWDHTPITDFWMIGNGMERRLSRLGVHTMRQIAETALADDNCLYREFGVDAEILIDHAFGVEPVRMSDVKGYKTMGHSISMGQVLMRNYAFDEAKVVMKEMTDAVCLRMASRQVATNTIVFFVAYSTDFIDERGLPVPASMATVRLKTVTNDESAWIPAIIEKYEKLVRRDVPIRRIQLCCGGLVDRKACGYQFSFFDSQGCFCPDIQTELQRQNKVQKMHAAVLDIKGAYGRNAILKGTNLLKAGTQMERNCQIGGHRAGAYDRVVNEKNAREAQPSRYNAVLAGM